MPAPYLTAHEIIQQAHTNARHPFEEALHIAETYGWEDRHTIDALHIIRQKMDTTPQPQPHPAIALADEYAEELRREEERETLPLATLVASFITTLNAYEQTGDPAEAEALERIEADLAHRVGLARSCDTCDEPMSPDDPRATCLACDLAPFGPEWEREQHHP